MRLAFAGRTQKGQWNLQMKDGLDGSEIDPQLSLLDGHEEVVSVHSPILPAGGVCAWGARPLHGDEGRRVAVTTVFDLLLAEFGVPRGLPGEYPENYDNEESAYTPAWQEKFTGVSRNTVIQLAREFATTAEKTKGKCTIIVGSGINHWYHSNLHYRSAITTLDRMRLRGGQWRRAESLHRPGKVDAYGIVVHPGDGARLDAPPASEWPIVPLRAQRSVALRERASRCSPPSGRFRESTSWISRRRRSAWAGLPFYPQFNRNPIHLVEEAKQPGPARSEIPTGLSSNFALAGFDLQSKTPISRKIGHVCGSSGGRMRFTQRQGT